MTMVRYIIAVVVSLYAVLSYYALAKFLFDEGSGGGCQ